MRFLGLSVLSVSVALLACGGSTPQPGALSSTWRAPEILSHVPADSPYVFASLEPVNEKLRQRMTRGFETQIAELMRTFEEGSGERPFPEPVRRAAKVLMDELRGKDPVNWGKELGFDPNGRFALYGLSVWPVLRIDIVNPTKLRSVVERVIAATGAKPRQATLDGRSYWVGGSAEIAVVAAVLEREAVMAVLPARSLPTAMPLVLGTKKPAQSLAASTKVPEMLGRHGLLGFLLAYIDLRNALDIFVGERPDELDAPIHAATGPIPPACRADLGRMVDAMPRMVVGYRRLDETGFDGVAVFETPASVNSALGKLHTVVPELAPAPAARPLMAFGVAVKPDEAVSWLREVAGGIRQKPFTCPWFKELNEGADKLAKQLATPMPPMLQGVRGFSVVIDDAQIIPPSVEGHVIVAGDRIADTVMTLASQMPILSAIPVKGDGRPVAIPVQQFGIPLPSAHVAMKGDRLVIAAGTQSAQRATDHLVTPAPKASPLFLLAFDTPRVMKLMATLGKTDATNMFGTADNIGMTLDVGGAGLVLDVWGTWPTPPTTPPASP